MTREEFEQLSVEYALGSLQGEDLERFLEYLRTAGQEELNALGELLGTATMLPLALDRKDPPARAREALLQKVRLSDRARDTVNVRTRLSSGVQPPPWRSRLVSGLAVAAVIIVVGLSVAVLRLLNTVDRQHGQLAASDSTVSTLTVQLTELKDELTRKEELLKVLSSRNIGVALMNGLKVNPVGYGKIIWDPERKTAILQVSQLPSLPHSKDYQLWVVKGKTPISAGVFTIADTSSNFFKIERLAVTDPKEISAFAVTLEPKGGVAAPTGEMYLAGSPRM